jgi:hypothetical protein
MTYRQALIALMISTLLLFSFISSSRGSATEEGSSPNDTLPEHCKGSWDGLDIDARRQCIQAELRDTDRQQQEIIDTVKRINALIAILRMQETLRHITEKMPSIPLRAQNEGVREGIVYDSHHNPLSEETLHEH